MTEAFDLLSIVYGIYGLVVIRRMIVNRASFRDDEWTSADRDLARDAGFFVVTPVLVLVHELGHAAATWLQGGRVLTFSWRGFWGYVEPCCFTPTAIADWWIAVSGPLAGTLAALASAAAGLFVRKLHRSTRTVLALGGAITAAFTLVGYPILSFAGLFGDYRTIYRFGPVAAASAVAAVVHAALVLGGRAVWSGWLDQRIKAIGYGVSDELSAARRSIRARRDDPDAWLEHAAFLGREISLGQARSALEEAVRRCGERPALVAALGRCQLACGDHEAAAATLTRAIELADPGTADELRALLAEARTPR